MTPLRVVLDTNVFAPPHFDLIDRSPFRELCRRRRVEPIYSSQFFEEMARAYTKDRCRADLLARWLPLICETGSHFYEFLPTIWHREVVRSAGLKVRTHMKPRLRLEMIDRIRALPADGSWGLIRETSQESQAESARLEAQRGISKRLRAEVIAERRPNGVKLAHRSGVASDVTRQVMSLYGRGMIERYFKCWDWRAVANRWERNPAAYRYFTQFVKNMAYKDALFAADASVPIDRNAQPDLDLMTFLLDADVFVSNEKGFARRAFQDLWSPRGKVMLTSEEFATLMHAM